MDEVINYVTETPGNTNPNVLRGMLQNSGGRGIALSVEMVVDGQAGKATLNKTWKEIFDADCVSIYVIHNTELGMTKKIISTLDIKRQVNGESNTVYTVSFKGDPDDPENIAFTTHSEDGYPEMDL